MRKVLYVPGPTEVDPDILAELSKPVIAHYGSDWNEIYNEACEAAKKIFRTKAMVTILPVPGSVALEMSVPNIVENDGDKVANISNGYFEEMIGKALRAYGAEVLEIESDYGKQADIEKLKETLDLNGDVKAVYVAHSETSTGVLNRVKEIARIVKKHDKLFIVDVVSSFGGVEFDFDGWGVDYAVGYASKCLSSVNGVCPVAISDRFIESVSKRKTPIRSYFFNLPIYLREVRDWSKIGHPHPTSIPTSVVRGLLIAERKALTEGLEKRYRRHEKIARAYRQAVRAMNLETLTSEEDASPTLTSVKVPPEKYEAIMSTLLERFGFMIGGSFGKIEGKMVRIAHMGITATPQYLLQLVPALELVVKELGMTDQVGPGIKAAEKVLWSS